MKILKSILLILALLTTTVASAQSITTVHGTVSDDMGPLMGATVCEIDNTGRIINSAITDLNGNFTMKVKNQKDKIRFSYVGLKTQTLPIDRSTYKVMMSSATTLKEVTVKSTRRVTGNGLPIPQREVSGATQSISMKEFEGLAITSVDEALQGRIAGLDIIGNSGDLGSGSTMRLRGASSMSTLTNSEPTIVVDGNIREVGDEIGDLTGQDLSQKFSELLNINPEDIADIRVLKDGAAAAIYGSQGANGVIEITTKRGVRGKPKLTYTFKLTATQQPKGYELLNGDDYTILLKESYFNPQQSDNASDIPELNYDPTFSEYEQYNNNTDWRKAVTQTGLKQNHYVTISGGGEKASFRIGAGYDHETGTMIKQKLQRYSTRVALDYNISERIRVSTNFALTHVKNDKNYENLLANALVKMPNMSIYEQDPNTGENTSAYYTMLQSASTIFDKNQKAMSNPVAVANLAKNQEATYDMVPELIINYKLLGLDEEHWRLDYRGSVVMNIFNRYNSSYYPQELTTVRVNETVNTAFDEAFKSINFNTKHSLTLIPAFKNTDHTALLMGRFELNSGSNNKQNENKVGVPTGMTTTKAGGQITGFDSNYNEWRSMYYTFSGHYAYKGRYIADASLRVDGTTKFGPSKRWSYNPGLSAKWIVSDEPWMKSLKPTLSLFAIRPGWGRVGVQPNKDYLYTSKYSSTDAYINMTAMYPNNIRLTQLRQGTTDKYNLGFDAEFFDSRLILAFEVYRETAMDILLSDYRIPSNAGFVTIPYRNSGKQRNTGWEFNINTNRLIKKGKFTMDMNVNFNNNRNEILEMDELQLEGLNKDFEYDNDKWVRRVQLHNPLGALYGFKYKGVYQYNYSTFVDMTEEDRAQFLAEGKTAPIALNKDGNVIIDSNGDPMRMMFNYSNENGKNYRFNGGDAIYEDINHDGQINSLDIVYLGSSLPRLMGGFGFTFNYGKWRLSTQFTYRVGNKIFNEARLWSESMVGNDNQSQAVNYRWRKEGDVTSIPRAMFGSSSNYNTLVSDRFIESGTYLRMGYASLSYSFDKKQLKMIGLNRLSFYLNVNNPFVLTKYTGVDPDIAFGGTNPAIDTSKTPRSRWYTFGLSVDF